MNIFTLRSGTMVTVRLLKPQDASLLVDLFAHLSPETRFQRFHVPMEHAAPQQVRYLLNELANVDQIDRIALLGEVMDDEQREVAIAVARAHREPGALEAEAALVVRDDYQNQGLGLFMLHRLVEAARARGIERFRAFIQANNSHMFHLLHKAGLTYKTSFEHGESVVVIYLTPAAGEPGASRVVAGGSPAPSV